MWNPFKHQLPNYALAYSPYPDVVEADTNSTVILPNAVYLDDAFVPDPVVQTQSAAMQGDYLTPHPDYDADIDGGGIRREIIYTPGPDPHAYSFLSPAPGSTDLAFARDRDSIPGTVYENIFHGPVSGMQMDVWQEGSRQQLQTQVPGNQGPVTGSAYTDYAHTVNNAYYQQLLTDYSTAAATDAVVNSI